MPFEKLLDSKGCFMGIEHRQLGCSIVCPFVNLMFLFEMIPDVCCRQCCEGVPFLLAGTFQAIPTSSQWFRVGVVDIRQLAMDPNP